MGLAVQELPPPHLHKLKDSACCSIILIHGAGLGISVAPMTSGSVSYEFFSNKYLNDLEIRFQDKMTPERAKGNLKFT